MVKFCKKHGKTEHSNGKQPRCRKCMIDAVNKRRNKIKIMSVGYLGGKCSCCGYDKCIAALEFHHINKNEKSFQISTRGYSKSWEKVKEELNKCELLCANCHREKHYKQIK